MSPEQKFLRETLELLVDHAEDIVIDHSIDDLGRLLSVTVHASDMGKVLGREGAMIKSLRLLVRAVGMKAGGYRVNLKVNEPLNGKYHDRQPRQDFKNYDEIR